MANILFNKKHVTDYAVYGSIAGLFYVTGVWYFLYRSDYKATSVLFIGSIFFMFVILIYAVKLTRRRSDYYSVWGMIISGQMAVAVGVLISVIGSFILIGIAGSQGHRTGDPAANNSSEVELIFIIGILENYGAGAFVSAMFAYALKPDQTRDETPTIFEEPADPKIL